MTRTVAAARDSVDRDSVAESATESRSTLLPLRHPQFRAASTRIRSRLVVAGLHRLLRQRLPVLGAKGVLHPAILQRMKADDRRPAAEFDALRQREQQPIQLAQLVVDRDAQGLE